MIIINKNCVGCGVCVDICPVTALRLNKTKVLIDGAICIDCGICAKKCPVKAINDSQSAGNVIVRDIRFQVTRECNFDCPWCFSDSRKQMTDELSCEEACKMVDQLAFCGLKTMTLTGGEPLLRKDFCLNLLQYLKKNKIYSKLFTNGSLLDEKTIDDISGIVDEVQISAYSKDYWPKTRLLFNQLKKHKIRTALRITLTSRNYHQVRELVKLAEESKVDILRARQFVAQGRGLKHKDYLMDGKAKESIGYLVSLRREKNYAIQLLTPSFPFLYDENIRPDVFSGYGFIGYTLCKCIEDMGTILPDGTVQPCGYFPHNLGNIRKQDFREIWSDKNKVKSELIVDRLDKECMNCAYITICGGGCRGNAFVNSGSLTAPDPNCPLVKRKANAFIKY